MLSVRDIYSLHTAAWGLQVTCTASLDRLREVALRVCTLRLCYTELPLSEPDALARILETVVQPTRPVHPANAMQLARHGTPTSGALRSHRVGAHATHEAASPASVPHRAPKAAAE